MIYMGKEFIVLVVFGCVSKLSIPVTAVQEIFPALLFCVPMIVFPFVID